MATQLFVPDGEKPNVSGIVLAGSADFKSQLMRSAMFDPRLQKIVLKVVDVSYGGRNGFNQAIELAADTLSNVKLVKEKRLLQKYMGEISRDTGRFCFMVDDTLQALDLGAVEDLIVWEDLDVVRYVLRNTTTGEETVAHRGQEIKPNDMNFLDPETGAKLEIIEEISLVEWMVDNHKSFGCKLELVTDCSAEGTQFVKGFGGIGGILRWEVDFSEFCASGGEAQDDKGSSSDDGGSVDGSEYDFDDGDFGF